MRLRTAVLIVAALLSLSVLIVVCWYLSAALWAILAYIFNIFQVGTVHFFPFLWKQIITIPFLLWMFLQKHLLKTIIKRCLIICLWVFVPPYLRRHYKRWQRFVRGRIEIAKLWLSKRDGHRLWRILSVVAASGLLTLVMTLITGALTICVDFSRELGRAIKFGFEYFGDFNFRWLVTRGWWRALATFFNRLPGRITEKYKDTSVDLFRQGIRRRKWIGTRLQNFFCCVQTLRISMPICKQFQLRALERVRIGRPYL